MKYNLLGQLGPEGQINSDAPEGGEYIYDNPPGQGNNPGISAPTPSPGGEEVTTETETETPNYFDIYTNLLNKTEDLLNRQVTQDDTQDIQAFVPTIDQAGQLVPYMRGKGNLLQVYTDTWAETGTANLALQAVRDSDEY